MTGQMIDLNGNTVQTFGLGADIIELDALLKAAGTNLSLIGGRGRAPRERLTPRRRYRAVPNITVSKYDVETLRHAGGTIYVTIDCKLARARLSCRC
jgi:hypothetical protein